MAICHGVAGHDNGTAILRAQPVRMIDGHVDGGYTGRYEVICPACGDDPNLSYDQVPTELQKIRRPRESLPSGLAALHLHIGLADTAPMNEAVTKLGARCHRRCSSRRLCRIVTSTSIAIPAAFASPMQRRAVSLSHACHRRARTDWTQRDGTDGCAALGPRSAPRRARARAACAARAMSGTRD